MQQECIVLPGAVGVFVQAFLLAACIAILVMKKLHEGPKRTWRDFTLDSSKQILGSGWMHILNLICAMILGEETKGADECSWYFINIAVDDTVGVAVEFMLVALVTRLFGFQTGEYGSSKEVDRGMYLEQLVIWLLILSATKGYMLLIMINASGPLINLSNALLAPFAGEPMVKLVVVMICFPVVLNSFQMWVTDSFIKRKEATDDPSEVLAPNPKSHAADAAAGGGSQTAADTKRRHRSDASPA
mmetsp:Transcript_84839/g.177387  ORF Transcript_84839/g.177387 Transcript_84839/m.177387 type:complete len:245 (+) Transcript_84839:313-1047(+)